MGQPALTPLPFFFARAIWAVCYVDPTVMRTLIAWWWWAINCWSMVQTYLYVLQAWSILYYLSCLWNKWTVPARSTYIIQLWLTQVCHSKCFQNCLQMPFNKCPICRLGSRGHCSPGKSYAITRAASSLLHLHDGKIWRGLQGLGG